MRVSLKIIGHRMAVIAHFQTQRCGWTSHLSNAARSRSNRLASRVPHDCLSLLIHEFMIRSHIKYQVWPILPKVGPTSHFPWPFWSRREAGSKVGTLSCDVPCGKPRQATRRACGRNWGCPVYWMRRPRKCKRFNGSYRVPSQESRVSSPQLQLDQNLPSPLVTGLIIHLQFLRWATK